MKRLITILLLSLIKHVGFAQNVTASLSPEMFGTHQQLLLAPLDGWVFKAGTNPNYALTNTKLVGWKKMKPTELTAKMADTKGKIEGWFRLKIKLDSAFLDMPLGFRRNLWAASDLYIDGELVHSFGNTNPYQAFNPTRKHPIPVNLTVGEIHTIALHVVDYETTFTQREIRLKPDNLVDFISLTGPDYHTFVEYKIKESYVYGSIWLTAAVLLLLLFWLLSLLNPAQKILRTIANYSFFVLIMAVTFSINSFIELSYTAEKIRFVFYALSAFVPALNLVIVELILKEKMSRVSIFITIFLPITSVFAHLFSISWPFGIVNTINSVYLAYLVFSSRKSLTATKWVVVLSMILTTVCGVIYVSLHKYNVDLYNVYENIISTPLLLSSPLALLFYVSFRFREILQEVAKEAHKVLKITEEKNNILATQNETLERQVEARTAELKASQNQLIQSEKLASLGELTAGIAHEIQNPLNFVNNFSEVSAELVQEIKEERQKPKENQDESLVDEIFNDISQNLEKITLHGKRASSIVKGMLEHSRTSTGLKEMTDINALADEYLRISYHGIKAMDNSFESDYQTDFETTLPNIEVIPQDMGRVLLNLINNAFWAVNERSKKGEAGYAPKVTVSTQLKANSQLLIAIKDNGIGMQEDVKAKIFQPFFTTKPTGQGTGLGLSLAYDIITKGHGGTLEVESVEGEGTEFVVKLPI